MKDVSSDAIGKGLDVNDNSVDNIELIGINAAIRYTVGRQVCQSWS